MAAANGQKILHSLPLRRRRRRRHRRAQRLHRHRDWSGAEESRAEEADVGTSDGAGLNASQREAVRVALAEPLTRSGPPGTGKTRTAANIIEAWVAGAQRREATRGPMGEADGEDEDEGEDYGDGGDGARVLVCAASNAESTRCCWRFNGSKEASPRGRGVGVGAVRLGHPARVLPGVQDQTLEALVQEALFSASSAPPPKTAEARRQWDRSSGACVAKLGPISGRRRRRGAAATTERGAERRPTWRPSTSTTPASCSCC